MGCSQELSKDGASGGCADCSFVGRNEAIGNCAGLKGQRNSGVAVWTAFGAQITIGGICAVILFAGKWTGNPWLPAIAFTGLTAAAVGGYTASPEAMNRLAERKRELLIGTLCR